MGATSTLMTATINIAAVNDAPVGLVKSYSGTEDVAIAVNSVSGLLAGATDIEGNTPLSVQLVSGSSHGAISLSADGSFTYTPNTNFTGQDTFTYTITDSLGAVSSVMTATLNISAFTSAPSGSDAGFYNTGG